MATQMEHDQSSYFCRGPDDFCWGLAPVGPTLVTGPDWTDGHKRRRTDRAKYKVTWHKKLGQISKIRPNQI